MYLAIALIVLNLIDLLPVSSRYLNKDKYVEEEDFNAVFTPTAADTEIKTDTAYFRVFNTQEIRFNHQKLLPELPIFIIQSEAIILQSWDSITTSLISN